MLACSLAFTPIASAQLQQFKFVPSPYEQAPDPGKIGPEKPSKNFLVRPYTPAIAPPVRLSNSDRLRSLTRGNILYLTVQDAIALAIENNIDLEVSRYDGITAAWAIQRAEAGGAARGVTTTSGNGGGGVTSGQGVLGSQQSAGINTQGGTKSSIGGGNASISQIGPVTQTLDPTFSQTVFFSHLTTPLNNTLQSGVLALVDGRRTYGSTLSDGFLTGGNATLSYNQSYLNEDVISNSLNPSLSGSLTLSVQHNLLQGFGQAVNARSITIARANLPASDLNFRAQVISVVGNVVTQYYQLVIDREDDHAKNSALVLAEQLLSDNRRQVEIGTLAPIEITRAEAQVASAEQDLTVSQTNLSQTEVALKNLLSRNGLADPLLATVQVVPIDKIQVPEHDDLPPLKDLITKALATRTDIQNDQINLSNARISALGTKNGVLPSLQVFGTFTNNGLAGDVNPNAPPQARPDAYFVGGVGTELGQIFRRNFPSERGGVALTVTLKNRTANADEAIDQLQLRQTELSNVRDRNQVGVLVSNAVIGLQQARSRYVAAVKNRILQEQLLDAEQKKFRLGTSTPYLVITSQRDLANARSAEVNAEAAYENARITLDQVVGTTLETLNISIDESRKGRFDRESVLPSELPPAEPVKSSSSH